MKTHIISIMNYKGGCTKTSSLVGLGAALARQGKKVLLVDCDPQSHVSVHLGIHEDDVENSIGDVLKSRGKGIADIIVGTSEQNLWVAPSNRSLLLARHELSTRPRREALLSRALRPVNGEFDFVLIDTPPDEGIFSVNAMYACQYLIIPTPLDAFSLTGINPLMDSVHEILDAYEDKHLEVLGVLVNRYDGRLRTENERNLRDLESAFGDAVFATRIRADEAIRKAQAQGETVFQHRGRTKGAVDFLKLADEVMHRVAC